MAKKKQEQQEQSQDEHVMAVLDKRTNKTAVISKMNEQDGSIEVVPPDKKNNNSFLKETGRKQRTQRRGTYRQTGPAV